MGKKSKKKADGRRSKTPGQTSASSPNPTATSPSVSSPTGDATTTSFDPSSAFPSAPPTFTLLIPLGSPTSILPSSPSQIITAYPLPSPPPRLIPLETPMPTSILPSSPPPIITNQPLPPPPALPVQETRQEFISSTSGGPTTTGLAGPSTSPSVSFLLPVMDAYNNLVAPAVACAMTALQRGMQDDPEDQEVIATLFGLPLHQMESTLQSLLRLMEIMKGNTDPEQKAAFRGMFKMEGLMSAIKLTEVLLAERKKRSGSGGSCGGSKGGGGIPDSGSGEGDGEGGGVSA